MTKLSIYLNHDDIKNIDTVETQQKILKAVSKCVKEIAASTNAVEIDIFAAPEVPVFTNQSPFFKMIGAGVGPSDLAENHDHYLGDIKHE